MRLKSVSGSAVYPPDELRVVDEDGALLEVEFEIPAVEKRTFTERLTALSGLERSGVWRYRELMPAFPDDVIVSKPEGNTNLYHDQRIDDAGGAEIWLKHEGENPTGSFKDRGMTVGVSHARWVGASVVACASTGNTSASVAAYAAQADMPAIVFVPEGKISAAKLAQTVAYGAKILQVRGDFDAAMHLVREASDRLNLYLLNSLNPFRLEGQKSIFFEALQQISWRVPDWVVVPGGNLGNVSALGKAIREALAVGLIDRVPRVAVIQASGAAPFAAAYRTQFATFTPVEANTVATAIQIGNPVNYSKAMRVIRDTEGVVETATDDEIMDAKALIDRVGIGCEPASATGVAGISKLVSQGTIESGSLVLTYLTGNLMKDSDAIARYHLSDSPGRHANRPHTIEPTFEALERVLDEIL